MAVCPECGGEVPAGAAACAQCGAAPATPAAAAAVQLPVDDSWVQIFTGHEVACEVIRDYLQGRGIPVGELSESNLGPTFGVGMSSTYETSYHTLVVSPADYEARRAEIDTAVSLAGEHAAGDAVAQAEAEQDYDVAGCSVCQRYFFNVAHPAAVACPGCGTPLLPAVEALPGDELAPEWIVVRHGPEAEAADLARRFEAAGFTARVEVPVNWSLAVVEVPWPELMDRTAEAERLSGSR